MNFPSKEQIQYLRRCRTHRRIVNIFRICILITFLFLWEYSANTGWINAFIFSSPSRITLCLLAMSRDYTIFGHVTATLYETLLSFFLTTLLSIFIAVVLWLSPKCSEIADPYLVVLNSLPKSALAPLLIVWLGSNQLTIIVAGMSVAIFGSIMNLHSAFQHIDGEQIKLIYTLQGSKFHALTKVIMPGSIPTLISSMKVNIGLCLVGVIIGEFLAARRGLGYLIIYSSQVFKMDWLLMSIALLCVMSMGLYFLIHLLESLYQKNQKRRR